MSVDLSLVYQGFEADISSLVEVTRDVVQEKLKDVAWATGAIAQRAIPSLPLKIDSCIEYALSIPSESYWSSTQLTL